MTDSADPPDRRLSLAADGQSAPARDPLARGEQPGGMESAPGPGQAARVPDFFIVGHPKSGTTALYEMLRRHPQIYMPELKEPRFFAPDLRARFLAGGRKGSRPQLREPLPETLEQYLALFAPARSDQLVGEASPSYLTSTVAAELIAAAQPRARIVALLREPVGFLRSLQLELVQNHIETERDFARAIERELVPAMGEGTSDYLPPIRRYSDRIRYVEQLRRFHAAFPAEQVLVLVYDDFARDNERTVRQVLRFLGVDASAPLQPLRANPTVQVRSVRLDRAVRRTYAGRGRLARATRATVKVGVPSGLRGAALDRLRRRLLYAPPPALDERFARRLRSRFKPEVVALGDYLGRDLVAEWGYDEID
ncbi:MAG TPA: sulfotransferase [Solirubrobacteraceae bacterium]|jgi:hypothetical protein|nr:sulfotransferase [Solirubrobacteraceae bacterium]